MLTQQGMQTHSEGEPGTNKRPNQKKKKATKPNHSKHWEEHLLLKCKEKLQVLCLTALKDKASGMELACGDILIKV